MVSYWFIWEDMSKTRASCFITGSKQLETDDSTRPRAFICFSVFGTRDEALALVFDILLLKLINHSSSDKPIACPHLGHMDASWYRGKEQRVWICKHECLDIQTREFGNQLEKAIHNFNKVLLLLLFAEQYNS